jgi:hypothetical protein
MFGLVPGCFDASVAEKLGPAQFGPRHRYFPLHPFPISFRRLDNRLVSRKTKNGAFRYNVSIAFLPSALLPIIILGVLTGYPLQRVVNEASQCQPVGSSKPQNCISYIKMGNWTTCNVTTRGSIYDTSHY